MTRSAEVRIVDRPGVFFADHAEVDGDWLHVDGRWRTCGGPNNEHFSYSERRQYTFPSRTVRAIRWTA